MKKHSLFLLPVLMCAALLLASCGQQIAEANDPTLVRLSVVGADTFQFTPDNATIPAASTVALTFKNAGSLNHNFIITDGEIDPLQIRETDALAGINTGIVPAGAEAELTFKAPDPGIYTFSCAVPGHAAAGMMGTLTVTDP